MNPDLLEIGLLVGFAVSSTGTKTSELSGFTATGVTYKQGPIILSEDIFSLLLRGLIHILLAIKHQGFGDNCQIV